MSTDRSDVRLGMLADLLAGEGSEHDVDSVADSPELAAALVDLEAAQAAVVADLGRLPRPVVPAGLEARIAAALLAAGPYDGTNRVPVVEVPGGRLHDPARDQVGERADASTHRADGPDPARRRTAPVSHVTGRPPASVVPLRRRTAPARNPWPLRAAAALALVAVGGIAIAALPSGGDPGDQGATTAAVEAAPESASAPVVPTSSTGTDYASSPGLLEAALPTLLGGAAAAAQRSAASERSAAAETGPGRLSEASGDPGTATTDPDAAAAPDAPVPAPFDSSAGSVDPEPPTLATGATPDPALDRLRDPDELAGCLSALASPDVRSTPAGLDYAAWAGEPALVVLLPTPQGVVQAGYDVFVVGADCRAGADDTLHFERVPA